MVDWKSTDGVAVRYLMKMHRNECLVGRLWTSMSNSVANDDHDCPLETIDDLNLTEREVKKGAADRGRIRDLKLLANLEVPNWRKEWSIFRGVVTRISRGVFAARVILRMGVRPQTGRQDMHETPWKGT